MIKKISCCSLFVQYLLIVILSILILISLLLFYTDYLGNYLSFKPILFSTDNEFYIFYRNNLRSYLFSGFLTMGSLLLSMHTFIILNMRDKVYLSEEYQSSFQCLKNIKNRDEINKSELLKPLDNLSKFVHLSIVLSLCTSFFQFTIGIYNSNYAAVFCIYTAILTIVFVLTSLAFIRENIKYMLHQK